MRIIFNFSLLIKITINNSKLFYCLSKFIIIHDLRTIKTKQLCIIYFILLNYYVYFLYNFDLIQIYQFLYI